MCKGEYVSAGVRGNYGVDPISILCTADFLRGQRQLMHRNLLSKPEHTPPCWKRRRNFQGSMLGLNFGKGLEHMFRLHGEIGAGLVRTSACSQGPVKRFVVRIFIVFRESLVTVALFRFFTRPRDFSLLRRSLMPPFCPDICKSWVGPFFCSAGDTAGVGGRGLASRSRLLLKFTPGCVRRSPGDIG